MAPVRVVVVEASTVTRRLMLRAFSTEPRLTVVGSATTAAEGVLHAVSSRPDIVVCDSDIGSVSGAEFVEELREGGLNTRVLVFASDIHQTPDVVNMLIAGAADVVEKTPTYGGTGQLVQDIKVRLIPRILELTDDPQKSQHNVVPAQRDRLNDRLKVALGARERSRHRAVSAAPLWRGSPKQPRVLIMWCTEGGAATLDYVVTRLGRPPVPVIIAQNLDDVQTAYLAQYLTRRSGVRVTPVESGDGLTLGAYHLMSGHHHVSMFTTETGVKFTVAENRQHRQNRTAADTLAEHAANQYDGAVLGLALSGTGYDGVRGSEIIRHSGGATLAVTSGLSVVPDQPLAAVRWGCVDQALSRDAAPNVIRRALADIKSLHDTSDTSTGFA